MKSEKNAPPQYGSVIQRLLLRMIHLRFTPSPEAADKPDRCPQSRSPAHISAKRPCPFPGSDESESEWRRQTPPASRQSPPRPPAERAPARALRRRERRQPQMRAKHEPLVLQQGMQEQAHQHPRAAHRQGLQQVPPHCGQRRQRLIQRVDDHAEGKHIEPQKRHALAESIK